MMKMHKGSIYPSDEKPKGKIEKKQSFFGKIKPMLAVEIGKVKIKCLSELNGIAENRTITFGSGVKGLDARYIFISAKLKLIIWLEAVLISAPAAEMEADSEAQIEAKRKLSNHAIQNLKGWRKINGDKSADLKAYARAPIEYLINLTALVKYRLIDVTARVASFFKVTVLERLANAIKAVAAVAKSRYNSFYSTHEATADKGEAVETESYNTILQDETATAISAVGNVSNVQSTPITEIKAFLYAWAMPEQVGNRLKIFQPYSAIQTGNRVAIDTESESAYWANPVIEGNRLKLVFAETATQSDNRLEVR